MLTDGAEVRTPTFDVPAELGAVRFYATVHGDVAACLPVPMPEEGASLAACR